MYDVNYEPVCGSSHGDWPRTHNEGDDVKEIWQVADHVQAVVEAQHEQVT